MNERLQKLFEDTRTQISTLAKAHAMASSLGDASGAAHALGLLESVAFGLASIQLQIHAEEAAQKAKL